MSLTPSHIIEYLFCPRFTYFEYVLAIPQYEEKDYKVMRGRHLHDERLRFNAVRHLDVSIHGSVDGRDVVRTAARVQTCSHAHVLAS